MRLSIVVVGLLVLVSVPGMLRAQGIQQTDWSGGGGVTGPVTDWEDRFDAAGGVSWQSVPGRMALSSSALGSPVEHLINDEYYLSFGIDSADLDGDGDTDIVGVAEGSRTVAVWWNEGGSPPTLVKEVIDTVNEPSAIRAADISGDGLPDVVVAMNPAVGKIRWWRNDGGAPVTWTRGDIDMDWGSSFEVFTDDVDGDGRADVLSTSYDRKEVAWWHNDGGDSISWTKHTVDAGFDGAHSVCTGDFDGDGDRDLVAAAAVDNQVAWWRNDGGDPISWTKTVIDTQFTGGRSVCTADFDGDGDTDIAGTCWSNHVKWWRNDGGDPVVWTEFVVRTLFDGGHSIRAADLNGDGRTDILAAGFVADLVAWWENAGGDPVSWIEHTVAAGYNGAIEVHSGDVDGDGDLDMLSTSYNLGEFTWWEISEFGESGELTGSILDTQGSQPGSIEWSSIEPPGTSLAFQIRSSEDPEDLGGWSSNITTPGSLGGLGRYVQYRVLLASIDPNVSPILDQVVFGPPLMGVESSSTHKPGRALAVRPNPFNPLTTLSFSLEKNGPVRLTVFSTSGRRVRALADGRFSSGIHELTWDGTDDLGRTLPSGVYWIRLEAGDRRDTRKMVLLR